jgi:hypothetical protein
MRRVNTGTITLIIGTILSGIALLIVSIFALVDIQRMDVKD